MPHWLTIALKIAGVIALIIAGVALKEALRDRWLR